MSKEEFKKVKHTTLCNGVNSQDLSSSEDEYDISNYNTQ